MKKTKTFQARHPARRAQGSAALALGTVFASPVRAAAPPPEAITPQLIEAAKKEGKVVWYTSIDLSVSEKIAAAFKEKFAGIEVRVERTGAERVFQRIGQEYASNVHAVDIANSSDAAHLLAWKRQGLLLPYVPEDVAKHYKPEHRDPDGTVCRLPRHAEPDRLQHQTGEGRGRAEEFCRSARPQMEGQDRQGASRLQRHHPDRDLPDGSRHRLGVLTKSSPSRISCRCSRRPIRRRNSRSASAA